MSEAYVGTTWWLRHSTHCCTTQTASRKRIWPFVTKSPTSKFWRHLRHVFLIKIFVLCLFCFWHISWKQWLRARTGRCGCCSTSSRRLSPRSWDGRLACSWRLLALTMSSMAPTTAPSDSFRSPPRECKIKIKHYLNLIILKKSSSGEMGAGKWRRHQLHVPFGRDRRWR